MWDFDRSLDPYYIYSDSVLPGFKIYSDKCMYHFKTGNDLVDTYAIDKYSRVKGTENRYISIYFDTGNQNINVLNQKLIREFKMLIGLPFSTTSKISNFLKSFVLEQYIDGQLYKEYTDTDLQKARLENTKDVQKLTLLTPGRGDVPRYILSCIAKADINLYEFAIAYMQLNIK
jgi:hypothetical protein